MPTWSDEQGIDISGPFAQLGEPPTLGRLGRLGRLEQRSGAAVDDRPGQFAAMWAMEIVDVLPGTPFDSWGIRPRMLRGLFGIVLAPFLHSGFPHLIANTIPFVVLGVAIAFSSVARFVEVVCIVALTSGGGTWVLGQSNSVHIGASGLVFGFLTYLVSRGIFARRLLWLIGGVLVMVVYGGILWGLLPQPGVSWTGHFFGAAGGVLAAWVLHGQPDDAPATVV